MPLTFNLSFYKCVQVAVRVQNKIQQTSHKSNTSHVQTPQNVQSTDNKSEELSCS